MSINLLKNKMVDISVNECEVNTINGQQFPSSIGTTDQVIGVQNDGTLGYLTVSGAGAIMGVNGTTDQITVNTVNSVATVSLPSNVTISGDFTTSSDVIAGGLSVSGGSDLGIVGYTTATGTTLNSDYVNAQQITIVDNSQNPQFIFPTLANPPSVNSLIVADIGGGSSFDTLNNLMSSSGASVDVTNNSGIANLEVNLTTLASNIVSTNSTIIAGISAGKLNLEATGSAIGVTDISNSDGNITFSAPDGSVVCNLSNTFMSSVSVPTTFQFNTGVSTFNGYIYYTKVGTLINAYVKIGTAMTCDVANQTLLVTTTTVPAGYRPSVGNELLNAFSYMTMYNAAGNTVLANLPINIQFNEFTNVFNFWLVGMSSYNGAAYTYNLPEFVNGNKYYFGTDGSNFAVQFTYSTI
jgi:hypothetical protein